MIGLLRACCALLVVMPTFAGADAAEPYVLLEPARSAGGTVLTRTGPDGQALPVLKRAADGAATAGARRILATGLAARIPSIDAAARAAAARKPHCPALPAAVFVYLSDEDGGYARQNFYVIDEAGRTTLCRDHYIDITADEASIASGEFEEVLAHEWGHVLLRRLLGPVPPTPSRKFHSVRTVTDPTTAFDEGFGIHLQPVAARLTATPGFRARVAGTAEPKLADLWFSRQETWMRQALVPPNRFVFDKVPPADGTAYERWLADEVSANLDACRLKSGDEMMASEGVAASVFHRLVATDAAGFDARYRQLITVLARIGGWPKDEPALIALVRTWGAMFPQERERVVGLFLATTYGATASQKVRALQEQAACAGAAGDIEAFLASRKAAQAAQDQLLMDVLAGRITLGAELGPQLWISNPSVRIPAAPWQGKRELPVVVDLNTASEPELGLVLTGTTLAGSAAAIVTARRNGAFPNIEKAASRAALDAAGRQVLEELRHAFETIGLAIRE